MARFGKIGGMAARTGGRLHGHEGVVKQGMASVGRGGGCDDWCESTRT